MCNLWNSVTTISNSAWMCVGLTPGVKMCWHQAKVGDKESKGEIMWWGRNRSSTIVAYNMLQKLESTHRVTIAMHFLAFIHHDGKISPAWRRWGVQANPLSNITYKVLMYAPAEMADTLPLSLIYPEGFRLKPWSISQYCLTNIPGLSEVAHICSLDKFVIPRSPFTARLSRFRFLGIDLGKY